MDKRSILHQLRRAKASHIQWRSYAQALIAGIPVEQDHVPVIHTTCDFGKWYYGPGQSLSMLSSYSAIETPHEMLHQMYMKIFHLLFGDNRSTMQKLFGSKAKMDKKNHREAEEMMHNLLSVSSTLLDAIELLEKEVTGMSEQEVAALY